MNRVTKYYSWAYVYCLTNKINNKKYVGWSFDPNKRLKTHIYSAEIGRENILYRAIRKYGFENFKLSILEKMSNAKGARYAERFWVAELKTNICRKRPCRV